MHYCLARGRHSASMSQLIAEKRLYPQLLLDRDRGAGSKLVFANDSHPVPCVLEQLGNQHHRSVLL